MLPLWDFGTVAFVGRRKPLFIEVQAHVLEQVAVDLLFPDRAADEPAVHDHAALADVINRVAVFVVFEPVDSRFPPKTLESRALAFRE